MIEWSIMRHDLKTALEVLKLPNYIRTSAYVRNNENAPLRNLDKLDINADSVIQLERRVNVCYVRACVLELNDKDWFAFKKGADFVKEHARHVGSEILLPLECRTKVRLLDRNGRKLYRAVREIVADFPRFVRAEQDTVAVTLGNNGHHVVSRGTVLELDRVTKSSKAIRGFRQDYLICRELEKSTELAFTLFTPVLFRKGADKTKYLMKDFIEQLPLPQCVEFLDSNPYDVVCESDEEACDLLTILNGPLELRSIQVVEYVVGMVLEKNCIIAIPLIDDFLEAALVHIPLQTSVLHTHADGQATVDYESIMEKMYLLYADNQLPVMLKGKPEEVFPYEEEGDLPDTPPLPPKLDDLTLKHTLSAPAIDAENGGQSTSEERRCRIQSTGEMESRRQKKIPKQKKRTESRGFKSYFSQISRRMKNTASQFLFGDELPRSDSKISKNAYTRSEPDLTEQFSPRPADKEPRSGFVCYLDITMEADDMKRCLTSLSHSCLHTGSEPKGTYFVEKKKISSQTIEIINVTTTNAEMDGSTEANIQLGLSDVTYADISETINNNKLHHSGYSTQDSFKDESKVSNGKEAKHYTPCEASASRKNTDDKAHVLNAKVDRGRRLNAPHAVYASADLSKKTRNTYFHSCDTCRYNLTS